MAYARGVVERAMKVQEVILRALSGRLTWLQAADILGRSPRSIRRLRLMYQRYGYEGLFDRRRQTPSPKPAPVAEVERPPRFLANALTASTSATSCGGPRPGSSGPPPTPPAQ